MTIQSLTALPTAPARTMAAATFVTTADAWVAGLQTFSTDINTMISETNAATAQVTLDAATVAAAADAVAANANFIGSWSAQTGAKTVPTSVAHNGETWILLSDIADITAKEPGIDSEWQQVNNLSMEEAIAYSLYF